MDTPLLIIFTRNPERGKVKTRLAAATDDDFALGIHEKLLEITKKAAGTCGGDVAVYYSEHFPERDIFSGTGAAVFVQKGKDLGLRMLNAFRQAFLDGYKRVVLIGTDCPGLSAGILRDAFSLLEMNGAVIGPAEDGGYYLIGLRALLPELFTGKRWSTPHVCEEALDALENNGVNCALLPELRDIDTIEDLFDAGLS